MTFENAEIYGFLSEYASAVVAFDSERAANAWGTPSTILTDHEVQVAHDHQEAVERIERANPLYRKLGLASLGQELIEVCPLDEQLVRVRVRWLAHDLDGAVLTAISYVYLIRRDPDGELRIYFAVPIERDEKIARLAARLGVDVGQ